MRICSSWTNTRAAPRRECGGPWRPTRQTPVGKCDFGERGLGATAIPWVLREWRSWSTSVARHPLSACGAGVVAKFAKRTAFTLLYLFRKDFHGTNSITCAKSVSPTFMCHPGSVQPESFANRQIEIQIVDTHESLATLVSARFAAGGHQMNQTLLMPDKAQNFRVVTTGSSESGWTRQDRERPGR